MYKYRCITQTTTMPKWWGPFLSASKLLSFLLYDLPLFTFPTLFSDIQRPEGPDFVGRFTYRLCPLYSFTFNNKKMV